MPMTTERIAPAQVAIDAFGGVRPLARLLNLAPSTVSRWHLIPAGYQAYILDEAVKRGLDVTAEDIVRGRLQA